MKTSFKTVQIRAFILGILLVVITTSLWLVYKNRVNGLENPLRSLGSVAGLNGVVFLSLNIILAARYKFLEKIFTGLDKLYRIHIATGITSYFLVFLHPLLIALSSDTLSTFFTFFIPNSNYPLFRNVGIIAFWIITILVFSAGVKKINYLLWKRIHQLMGPVFLLIALHSILADASVANFTLMSVWILGIISFALFSFIYKVFLYYHFGPVYLYKIKKINVLPELFDLYMTPVSNRLVFKPGQFAFLSFINSNGVNKEPHPYTFASNPLNKDIRICIKKLGDWSHTLEALAVGDKVKLFGPYGAFYSNQLRKSKRQVWIAGGIGITPFLSMAESEITTKSYETITLVYSDNTSNEAVFAKEVESFQQKSNNIKACVHISNEQGYLTADFIKEQAKTFEDTVFLLCGPAPMTNALKKQLLSQGVKESDIVFEYFNFK